MITKAKESQTEEIRDLWRICFPEEDPKYIEYFFKNLYHPEDCFVYLLEGKIVSAIVRNKHAIMFNGRALQASMLVGAATLPEYRHHGYMRALFSVVIDACEHSELLTLLQTENPKMYTSFGFRTLYRRSEYILTRADCKRTTNFGCGFNPTAIDLLKVYSAFISRFNGYYARDLEYFVRYLNEIRGQGGKVVAYFNGKDQIQGYAAMIPSGNEMIIQEMIYLDSLSMTKLINAALQEKRTIRVYVSEAEDLSLIFPKAPKKTFGSTMARLNSPELFTKLYGKRVNTVEDIETISQRPLNLNEFA